MTTDRRRRDSTRLPGYDYSMPGAYYVTVCVKSWRQIFGKVSDGCMAMNDYGWIVNHAWLATSQHFSNVCLDSHIVMPNHLHGVIILTRRAGPERKTRTGGRAVISGSLSAIVRSFKSGVTKMINEYRNGIGKDIWQRGYYEHIIRNDRELRIIRRYIQDNPIKWASCRKHHRR